MNALLKCCHQVSAFACLAVPYRAHALEGIKKSAYFASRAADLDADQCRAMLRPILRPELKYAMNKYMSYFFRPVYEGERVVDKIEASAELTNNLNQLLQSTGCGRSLQDIADGLHFRDVARFKNCSIDVLRAELKDLHDAGVADLMEETMPEEAQFIRHYEQFMGLLEKRSAD